MMGNVAHQNLKAMSTKTGERGDGFSPDYMCLS